MVKHSVEHVGGLSWELVDAPEVPGRLQADVDHALGVGEEVSLKAMHVILDDATRPIVNMLVEAAQEHPEQAAKIDFQTDAFALRYGRKPEHWAQMPELSETVETLKELGATALFTNPYFSSLHRRFFKEMFRDHRKGHTAGGVLWLGGSNLHQENFDGSEMTDFMLRTENDAAANLVRSIFRRDARRRLPGRNHDIELNDSNHLLLDGGIPLSSHILRTVHQLADDMIPDGEPALFTSQYYPTLKIARMLHDHPDIVAAFNKSTSLDGHGMKAAAQVQQLLEHIGPDVLDDKETDAYVHAKTFSTTVRPSAARDIFPEYEGRVGVLGTHNLNRLGVLAGTCEMAVITTDPDLLDQHKRWMKEKFDQVA